MDKIAIVILGMFISILGSFTVANAVPSQVIVIRHADKWPVDPGYVLSPTGYLRAVKFSQYYFQKFQTIPDFLFASNSFRDNQSLRPIQTLAPLAGHKKLLKKKVTINHTFGKGEEKELVKEIMTSSKYDNKTIIICWQHGRIGEILNNFTGSKDKIVWSATDYDTVYVLNFKDGKLVNFSRLDKQYPVDNIASWEYFLGNK
jgi:hypothetical protein